MKTIICLVMCTITFAFLLPTDLPASELERLAEVLKESNQRWTDERLPQAQEISVWYGVAHSTILDIGGFLILMDNLVTANCLGESVQGPLKSQCRQGLILNTLTLRTIILELDKLKDQLLTGRLKELMQALLEFAEETLQLFLSWMPSEVRSQINSTFGELDQPSDGDQSIVDLTSTGTASLSVAEEKRVEFAKRMSVGIGDGSAITARGNDYTTINFMTPDMSDDIAILLYPKVKDLLIQYGFERAEFTNGGAYNLVLKPLEGEPVSTDSQSLSQAVTKRVSFAKYANEEMDGEALVTVRGDGYKIFNYSTPIMTQDYAHLLHVTSKEKLIELGFEWAEYTDGGDVNFAYNLKL